MSKMVVYVQDEQSALEAIERFRGKNVSVVIAPSEVFVAVQTSLDKRFGEREEKLRASLKEIRSVGFSKTASNRARLKHQLFGRYNVSDEELETKVLELLHEHALEQKVEDVKEALANLASF
jgi:hypothetical protein